MTPAIAFVQSRSSALLCRVSFLVAAAAVSILPVSAVAQSVAVNHSWAAQNPAVSPTPREASAMAYDPAFGYVVLLGGNLGGVDAYGTWTWDGSNWTSLNPANYPPARDSASMVYDAQTGKIVLFGGEGADGYYDDTWTWDGTNWTQLNPANHPSARYSASMAYDAQTGKVVLFGGTNFSAVFGDTWTWDGTNWTQQSPATNPPARYHASMAYDARTSNVLLFGGENLSATLSDTWTWGGTNWTQSHLTPGPTTTVGNSMAYDAQTGNVVLFGEGETWIWNGSFWAQQDSSVNISTLTDASVAYDEKTGTLVLFGGSDKNANLSGETYLWGGEGNFGSRALDTTSGTLSAGFTVAAGTKIGSIGVVSQGVTFQEEFTQSGTTCLVGDTYGSTANCAVIFAINPRVAGTRQGAVVFFSGPDTNGKQLGSLPISMIGTGPQIAFGPGTATTVNGSLSGLQGLAVDSAGDIFVSVAGNSGGEVWEIPVGGAPQTVVASGLGQAEGIALDGAGDLFVADSGKNQVVEVPAGGGAQTTIGAGLKEPMGVAADGAGNVFIADYGNNRVVEIPFGGGLQTAVGQGLNEPSGVAVDGAGDVFIADTGNNRIVETWVGGSSQIVLGTGLSQPASVTVDAAGDVFIADSGNGRVVEAPAGGGDQLTLARDLNQLSAVVLDGPGDIFYANASTTVTELKRSRPPAISFPTATTIGSTDTTDGSQTVEVTNIGNQPLVFNGVSYPTDFPDTGNSQDPCTSSTSLSPGSECDLDFQFSPKHTGSLSENITLDDNNHYVVNSVRQLIALSGTGAQIATTTEVTSSLNPSIQGQSVQFTATVSPVPPGTGTPTGSVSFLDGGNPLGSAPLSGGVATYSTTALGTGTHTITATYQGGQNFAASSGSLAGNPQVVSAVSVPTAVTISVPPTVYLGGAFNFTVTVYDQFSNVFTGYTGTMAFTTGDTAANLPSSYTFTTGDAGTHVFSATFNTVGSWTIKAADSVTASLNASTNSISVTIPNLVVTTHVDNAGKAPNCTAQTTPGAGTDASCSLRDALLESAALGSASITFDKSTFTASNTPAHNTITLGSAGTLAIPPNVTITGATTGTGLSLTNLVAVDGAGSYQVMNVATGSVNLSNLIIQNGNYSGKGGGIGNSGTLTLTNSTLTGNSSSIWGGAVYSNGPITISGTTMANNSSSVQGGALVLDHATATITDSTFTANQSFYGGGIYDVHGTMIMSGVTVAGNHASYSTNDDYDFGSLTLSNAVIGDLNTVDSYTDKGGNVTGATGLNLAPLGNYGGPTQTMIPLPGSTAICAALASNATAANLSADQRGLGFNSTYCPTGSVDAGAVQTDYALSFTKSPTDTVVGQTLSPTPVVALTENTTPFAGGAVSVSVAPALGTMTGTKTQSTSTASDATAGTATFGGLSIVPAEASDSLTATVALTSAINLTAKSALFNVTAETLSVTCPANNSGTPDVVFNSGPETVNNGIAPYMFSLGSGTLPNGLTINASNGAVSGTPASSSQFSIAVKDAEGVSGASCPYTIGAQVLNIAWPTPAAITYGTQLSASQLDATANVQGSFSYNPLAGTVLAVGTHQLSATFTPTDTVDYKVTTVHVNLVVNKATPVVTWTPATLQINSKLTTAQLDAKASVPGKFVYTPALGATVKSSAETLKSVFTPTDTKDYNSVTTSVSLSVNTVKLSTTSINFGIVYLDTITTKTITVTNLGSSPVTIYDPLISIPTTGDSHEFLAVNLCLKPLAPKASCTIRISYVAGPFYHQQSATLGVKYTAAGSPQTVSLTGLTIDPQAALSTASLNFGMQKTGKASAAKTITVKNTGATTLAIGSVTISGTNPHDFTATSKCGSSLAAGSSCAINVTFKPAAKGARTAKLTIKDNAQNSSQSLNLSGTGD